MLTTWYITQGDNWPPLTASLAGPDGEAVDLTGCVVTFSMRTGTGVILIDKVACSITNAVAGEVMYTWSNTDTQTAGEHQAEFEVTLVSGKVESFPNDSYLLISIRPQVR